MIPPRPRVRLAAAAILAVVFASGCYTTARQHPDFAQRRAGISTVAVIPPEISVIQHVFKGDDKPLPEEEAKIRGCLPSIIERTLVKHGFTVKDANLDEKDFEEDPDLRFETTQIKEAFNQALSEMYERDMMRKSKARKYERSLGPDVNQFADQADVDAIFFSKLNGFRKSKGERTRDYILAFAMAVAVGSYTVDAGPGHGASLYVGLVDGTNGDILWANKLVTVEEYGGCSQGRLLKKLFKDFPE